MAACYFSCHRNIFVSQMGALYNLSPCYCDSGDIYIAYLSNFFQTCGNAKIRNYLFMYTA